MGVLLSLNYYTIQKKLFFDAKSEIFIDSPQGNRIKILL